LPAQIVVSDRAKQQRGVAHAPCVRRKIERRSTEARGVREDIPKHLPKDQGPCLRPLAEIL